MDISFFKQQELKKARGRWQWAYFIAYANAVFVGCSAFLIKNQIGRTEIGVDPVYTMVTLVCALILAALAWGIQRRLSLICMWVFFLIVVLNTIYCSTDPEYAKDTIGSAIAAVFLFRGILGVREIKKLIQEDNQKKQLDETVSQPAL